MPHKQNYMSQVPFNSTTKAFTTPVKKKPLIELVMGSKDKFNLILTEGLMRKINYLCEEIPNNEWSGIVFYTPNGSITNIPNLTLTAFDVYPLDIGTSTYTEFEYTPDLTGYMASNPDLLDAQMGLIHSHNHMNTFFSGTDTATLREQAPLYKTFLSVIVNNRLEVDAALAVESHMTTTKRNTTTFQDFNYKEASMVDTEDTVITKTVALRFDANITKEYDRWKDEGFAGIVNKLKKDVTKHSKSNFGKPKTANKTVSTINNKQTNGWGTPFDDAYQPTLFPEYCEIDEVEPSDILEYDTEYIQKVREYLYAIASLNSYVPLSNISNFEDVFNRAMLSVNSINPEEYADQLQESIKKIESDLRIELEDKDDFIEFLIFAESEFNDILDKLEDTHHTAIFIEVFNDYLFDNLSDEDMM